MRRRWQQQGPPLARPLGARCADALAGPAGSSSPAGPVTGACDALSEVGVPLPLTEGLAREEVPAGLQAFLLALCEASMARYGSAGASGGRPPGRRAAKRQRHASSAHDSLNGMNGLPVAHTAEAHPIKHQGSPAAGDHAAAAHPPGTQRCRASGRVRVAGSDAEAERAWRAEAALAVRASELRCWQALRGWLRRRSSAQLVAGRCARFWRCPCARRRRC